MTQAPDPCEPECRADVGQAGAAAFCAHLGGGN